MQCQRILKHIVRFSQTILWRGYHQIKAIARGEKRAANAEAAKEKIIRRKAVIEYVTSLEAASREESGVVAFGADLSGAKLGSLRHAAASESRDEAEAIDI